MYRSKSRNEEKSKSKNEEKLTDCSICVKSPIGAKPKTRPINQVLTSNPTHGKLGPLCKIFSPQQIDMKKNGFHSLADWEIGVLKHIK